ncbi:winged helix-turn-helix domain-containing protein [Halobacteriales archaeon SW_8_65_20]|nr:MAG: winged helix-turn-helix domain-containing protein [Halobacteriales archaeon SW_8_65_20]
MVVRFNECDEAILPHLQAGRVTAAYLETEIEWSRSYITQRLKRMEEHCVVQNLGDTGLYELDSNELDPDSWK